MLEILIQGITEAFPISSSMHLTYAKHMFNLSCSTSASLHLGSSLAFALFSRSLICNLIFNPIINLKTNIKLFLLIIPTLITGLILKKQLNCINSAYSNIFFAIIMLLSNQQKENITLTNISFKKTIIIGLLIISAFIPGASRMGITYTFLRFFNFSKQNALSLTILTGIPIISSAAIYTIIKQNEIISAKEIIATGILTYLSLFITQKTLNFWHIYSIYRIIFSFVYLYLNIA